MDPSATAVQEFLTRYRPFDTLDPAAVAEMAEAAEIERYEAGELILDAFTEPNSSMFVVVDGEVDLWQDRARILEAADERLGPGEAFGFSSMLTERSVGPRVVAAGRTNVLSFPAAVVAPAFTSTDGARFLAEHVASAVRRGDHSATYSLVEDLLVTEPVVVPESETAYAVACRLTESGQTCVVVERAAGYGIATDALLRRHLIVDRRPDTTPIGALVTGRAPTVRVGESVTEALIGLLEADQEFLLVVDQDQHARGVVAARDFLVSPTTAGASLHEQLRRASDVDGLAALGRRLVASLDHLLAVGVSSDRVVAIYSTLIDTLLRRAIVLVFDQHPHLSRDSFTWLSLGSNGRREAVPSSDVDCAVAFVDGTAEADQERYRAAFGEVLDVVTHAGLSTDRHGATASRKAFSRTNEQWRIVGRRWMAAPEKDRGAIMASLLVDGRAIFGDSGLPTVSRVFTELRRHHGTMRLLLQESLAHRARMHSVMEMLTRRDETFDIKRGAILPVVNLARWAALSVGSSALPTTARLRAAAGSAMLPRDRAANLVAAFEVLQRLRLRYQLWQVSHGAQPTDVLVLDELSSIDRGMLQQAVREVAAAQRRMDNVSQYVPIEHWTAPEES